MPRSSRLDAPGVLHHVIIRGIERRKIFLDDEDRDDLLDRVSELLPETRTACYAWALMPNHAHFLLRSGPDGISHLMRRLLTGYAVHFNHRHGRHGPLFQNRFKSIVCQEDSYFKELVRYIHLNPLRGGFVLDSKALACFPYSGHSGISGEHICFWHDVDYVLSHFGDTAESARKRYSAYVDAGTNQGRRPDLVGGEFVRSIGGWAELKKRRKEGFDRKKSDARILGNDDFVTAVLAEAREKRSRQYAIKRRGVDLKTVERRISSLLDIDRDDIYSKGRRKTQVLARSLLCYWAVKELGMSCTEMAVLLGMSQPGVGYAVGRGERIAKENRFELLG